MSLSWRDRLIVDFAPQQLRLRRLAAGWRGGASLAEAHVDCAGGDIDSAEPAWVPALAALRTVLSDSRWQGSAATVLLSGHFVRYLTIPWDEQLVTAEEQQAMVRHAFVQAHGSAADGWALRWDAPPAPAPCLACAIDGALLAGLRDACTGAGLRLASVQPQLMAALNVHRDALPAQRDCWFLLEEPGRLCLAWVHGDSPAALYSQRVGDDWPGELPGVLERGMLLAAGSGPGAVYLSLAAAREVSAELPAGWSLHLLPPVPAGAL